MLQSNPRVTFNTPQAWQQSLVVKRGSFRASKRLSSLAGETVYGIPAAAFIIGTYLAISSMLQVQQHNLQRT